MGEPPKRPKKKPRALARSAGILGWGMLAGLVVVVGKSWSDEKEFVELLGRVHPWWILAGIAIQLGTYASEAALWHVVLQRLGARVSLGALFELAFVKLFTDSVLPTGGVAGSALVVRGLEKRGVPEGPATAVLVVNVIGSYPAIALGLGVSLLIIAGHSGISAVVIVPIAAFSVMALVIPGLLLFASGRNGSSKLRRVPLLRELLEKMAQVSRKDVRDPVALGVTIALELVVLLCDAATLYVLLDAVGEHPSFPVVYAAFVVAMVAGVVSVIPAGLGTFDAACVALLSGMGVRLGPALMATLLLRGLTQFLPMLPGSILAHRQLRE